MQKPAPDQRRAFIHTAFDTRQPTQCSRPLLPGRGVQGERGEGSGASRVSQSLTSRLCICKSGREGLGTANPAKDGMAQSTPAPEQSLEGSHEVGGGVRRQGGGFGFSPSCPFKKPIGDKGVGPSVDSGPWGVHRSSQGQA